MFQNIVSSNSARVLVCAIVLCVFSATCAEPAMSFDPTRKGASPFDNCLIADSTVEDEQPDEATNATGSRKKRTPIKGNVSHTDRLPPVEEKFKVGAEFNNSILKGDSGETLEWYRIPAWLAGTWKRSEETVVYQIDLRSGHESRTPQTVSVIETANFGVQVDSQGYVWHAELSNRGLGEGGNYRVIALIRFQKPERAADDEVILRQVTTQLFVNPINNTIARIYQSESLNRFSPEKNGSLKTDMSVKFFDAGGKPISIQRNESVSWRTEEFKILNQYKGRRLDEEFKAFLRSQGKEELVPR